MYINWIDWWWYGDGYDPEDVDREGIACLTQRVTDRCSDSDKVVVSRFTYRFLFCSHLAFGLQVFAGNLTTTVWLLPAFRHSVIQTGRISPLQAALIQPCYHGNATAQNGSAANIGKRKK